MGCSNNNKQSLISIIDITCNDLEWSRQPVYKLYREYEKLIAKEKTKINYKIFKEYLNQIGIKIIPETEETFINFFFTFVCHTKDKTISFRYFGLYLSIHTSILNN